MIYRLKITLRGSRPPIWRRVEVDGNISLGELHEVIQVVMGWEDAHLHQFIVDDVYYSTPYIGPEGWGVMMMEDVRDANEISLQQVAVEVGAQFVYEYDFGDSWEHVIRVEQIKAPEVEVFYPICLTGKRAGPPEDVGGVWGYEEFLSALENKNHPEHEMYSEWIEESFDPEHFDLEESNRILSFLDFYKVFKCEKAPVYTDRQGQYLTFIYYYTKLNGYPPAQADIQRYFRVSGPAVNSMLKTLEKRGLISRVPRQPRSIKLLLSREELPDLE